MSFAALRNGKYNEQKTNKTPALVEQYRYQCLRNWSCFHLLLLSLGRDVWNSNLSESQFFGPFYCNDFSWFSGKLSWWIPRMIAYFFVVLLEKRDFCPEFNSMILTFLIFRPIFVKIDWFRIGRTTNNWFSANVFRQIPRLSRILFVPRCILVLFRS